jgi:hypothetical protein
VNRLHVSDKFLVAAARLGRAEMVRDAFCGKGDDATCPVDLIGALNYACHGEPGVPNCSHEPLAVLVDMLDLDTRLDPIDAVAEWFERTEPSKTECVMLLDDARLRTEPKP